ncbi:hypothetical protein GGS23DRAFT_517728 [Durotheca rogersii]|uniref:uncharacterized protein n=1 Tax=Durotheca rogersii TaxID=419775 RepID=UPI0022205019|nr:uncharacterized protein GGS23DRAFT_517728 [Durotheca rogersii]KAI5863865.1 hypothetical protein GGS23DRAFT_517728 [Durotheca rogersii]
MKLRFGKTYVLARPSTYTAIRTYTLLTLLRPLREPRTPRTFNMPREERRVSFGIGGAGNIRTPDEAVLHGAISAADAVQRRKSSPGGTGSSSTKSEDSRASNLALSFKSMFRRSRHLPPPEGPQ